MTEKTMTVGSVILCDDFRTEITGKNILIGVYDPVFSVSGFPIKHKFALAFIVNIASGGKHSFRFRIKNNADGHVTIGKIQLITEEPGKNVSLPAAFFNLEMKESSTLDIDISYPNQKEGEEETWENVGVWKIIEDTNPDTNTPTEEL